jgi:hypothetical protein
VSHFVVLLLFSFFIDFVGDLTLLLDDVKKDIEFLSKCWKLQGRPIYVFLVREQNLRGPQRNELLELLSQFKQVSRNMLEIS